MNNANAAVNPNSKLFIEQRPAKIPSNTKNTRENDFCIAITSVRPQSIGKRVRTGKAEEALTFLVRLPETDRVRKLGATARLAMNPIDNLDVELDALLLRVKDDEIARREYLDILETMGTNDPRTGKYRKLLTQKLF